MSTKPPSLLSLILILVVLGLFGAVGAKFMLNRHSDSTMGQLALVWPGIGSMPQEERGLLFELALTCNVVDRKPERAEVIACLRDAAATLNPPPTAQLERLISQAPQG